MGTGKVFHNKAGLAIDKALVGLVGALNRDSFLAFLFKKTNLHGPIQVKISPNVIETELKWRFQPQIVPNQP